MLLAHRAAARTHRLRREVHEAPGRESGRPSYNRCCERFGRGTRTHGARRGRSLKMIPARFERRARWVLDTIGARDVGFGDDLPYRPAA